ncbi:MAG: hypothetical protein Q8L05_02105 [Actinomycetota bacterium]|nr:hypothetical protein [Actinomycetota bacterium]MDP2288741.1 hypothetical protein [Actinomycetota bacterium]
MSEPEVEVVRPNTGRQSASALYGLIIACAVLATASPDARLVVVALTVIGTLAIYWIAETYVHVMAARQAQHRELTRAQFAAIAKDGLPLITVTFAPLLALLVAALLGLSAELGENIALAINIALLLTFGYRMSRDAGIRGMRLVISTLLAGFLGLAMVTLKIFLNH